MYVWSIIYKPLPAECALRLVVLAGSVQCAASSQWSSGSARRYANDEIGLGLLYPLSLCSFFIIYASLFGSILQEQKKLDRHWQAR